MATVTASELLATAVERLVALDGEVRTSGSFAERAAVARELAVVAELVNRTELERLQAYAVRLELHRLNGYLASSPGHLAHYQPRVSR